jgi:hypothetical protein
MPQPALKTVSIYRRNYGPRYTGLPVDSVDAEGFSIDCSETYMRPERFDLCVGDLVRWWAGEGFSEAVISAVQCDEHHLRVQLHHARQLPEDFFPY